MKPIPDRFRDENVQKTYQQLKVFWQKPYIFQKTKPRDPFQMKDLEISHLLVLWIPLYDQIWPIWWRKRVKNLSKWRFPTVPDSSQGFTEASRRFPILLEGLRWCPKVPSLLPRRCMLRKNWSPSVEKKVITECREKSACQERSAYMSTRKKRIHVKKKVITAWREKMMTDECWLLIDHWSLMIDD